MKLALLSFMCIVLLLGSVEAQQPVSSVQPISALQEQRYCGPPVRTADGSIRRRSDVLTAFNKVHPCPATGLSSGACPGWHRDHIIPLSACGCDAVSNLQWLPVEIKTCKGDYCKDRWERKVYTCPKE